MHIMVGKILRVELHSKDAVSAFCTHGLNDAVLGAAVNLKTVSRLLDRLMVHAVGFYFGRASDVLKDAPLFKANGMHRLAVRRLLLMRFFGMFCWDSISWMSVPPMASVEHLNPRQMPKIGMLRAMAIGIISSSKMSRCGSSSPQAGSSPRHIATAEHRRRLQAGDRPDDPESL